MLAYFETNGSYIQIGVIISKRILSLLPTEVRLEAFKIVLALSLFSWQSSYFLQFQSTAIQMISRTIAISHKF